MDRKSIIVLAISCVVLFAWLALVPKLFPPIPLPRQTNAVATATNQASTTTNVSQPPTLTAAPTNIPPTVTATNVPEQTETIENPDAIYTFTTHGGGLKLVQLKKYLETVGCDRPSGSNQMAAINDHAWTPALALLGDAAFGDSVFTLTKTSPTSLRAEKALANGLRVIKEFSSAAITPSSAVMRFENPSAQAVALPAHYMSIGPRRRWGRAMRPLRSGFSGTAVSRPSTSNKPTSGPGGGCFNRPPKLDYTSGSNRIDWAAVHNQFFALAVMPGTNAFGSEFVAHRINLPVPTAAQISADPKVVRNPTGIEGSIANPAVTIAPNQTVERQYTIYAGPKQAKTLAKFGRGLDAIMDFGFFSPISRILLRAMNALHRVFDLFVPSAIGAYGIALIVMTIIIKLLFWPLTQASTRSMKRMQALAPEMKKLQEKYKEDPVKLNKKTMEFWREHKVNPMSGCWPMLIQLPIFFALFRMIPNAIELRGTRFLWACDLSKSDTLLNLAGLPLNPMPLIMGVTMFWQARLQPPSPGMDPAQQAMMKYMPLLFLVFLYNQPAGLTLYWTVQNLLTIAQTKLTKAKEEPAKAAPVPVTPPKKKK
jgi:YidC/Oxa1 family membrane protein insertase